MASAPSNLQNPGRSCSPSTAAPGHDENHCVASTLPSQSEECSKTPESDATPFQDEEFSWASSWSTAPREPASMENRLRPATDIINRIIWDSSFDRNDYTIVYEDRFEGRLEVSLGSWKKDLTDEEFIPQHRILYIKRKSDDEVVWDRRRRIDKIFKSGNSAFSYLDFLS